MEVRFGGVWPWWGHAPVLLSALPFELLVPKGEQAPHRGLQPQGTVHPRALLPQTQDSETRSQNKPELFDLITSGVCDASRMLTDSPAAPRLHPHLASQVSASTCAQPLYPAITHSPRSQTPACDLSTQAFHSSVHPTTHKCIQPASQAFTIHLLI